MKHTHFLALLLLLALLASCGGGEKKRLPHYDTDEDTTAAADDTPQEVADNVIEVPFTEQNGVKLIDVTVNGQMTVKMILDSGCSETLISLAEADYLYEKGCITDDDILRPEQVQIADGSIVVNSVVNLREVIIAGRIRCNDVRATVTPNPQASLLLGNGVLNRVAGYTVDNDRGVVRFELR